MVPDRQTADERRSAVLAAAVTEFARSGYAGTSTEAIARRAGISQPYLFRLFGTKKDLFIATYDLVSSRIVATLARASEGLEGEEACRAMGVAYVDLLQDSDLLRVELNGFAAAPGDPDIARICRRTFAQLWEVLGDRAVDDDDEIRQFFAMGMLMNVMSAIDLLSGDEPWSRCLVSDPEKLEAIRDATAALHLAHDAERAETQEVPA
jgi:AcrR family transcriptional regulator